MPFIVWNDRMSVDVEALDGDHRNLVNLLNELYDGVLDGCGPEKAEETLLALLEHVHNHFAREEELLSATGYPALDEHKRQHDAMRAWVNDEQAHWEANDATAPRLEILNYLKDWLFDHILGSDRLYVEHLRAHGVR